MPALDRDIVLDPLCLIAVVDIPIFIPSCISTSLSPFVVHVCGSVWVGWGVESAEYRFYGDKEEGS